MKRMCPVGESGLFLMKQMIHNIMDFQKRYGLTVDGIIGPQTKGKATEVKSVIDYILHGYGRFMRKIVYW